MGNKRRKIEDVRSFQGQKFKEDSGALYDLLVQHVGTTGTGSNIISRHKSSKNGRKCYLELKGHFRTASHEETKARSAKKAINDAHYFGERSNFNLENYYDIFTKVFNDLDDAGGVYELSEEQKINEFKNGLRKEKAISYSITARNEWETLVQPTKIFEDYFAICSASLTKHKSLSNQNIGKIVTLHGSVKCHLVVAGAAVVALEVVEIIETEVGGRSAGRGRGRSSAYNPYHFTSTNGPFVAEARIYPADQWKRSSGNEN